MSATSTSAQYHRDQLLEFVLLQLGHEAQRKLGRYPKLLVDLDRLLDQPVMLQRTQGSCSCDPEDCWAVFVALGTNRAGELWAAGIVARSEDSPAEPLCSVLVQVENGSERKSGIPLTCHDPQLLERLVSEVDACRLNSDSEADGNPKLWSQLVSLN